MEILVLGDGRFVFTVLNAVASVDSYRVLGAAGALIGLVIILLRGVVSPQGPQLNLAPILLSIVFFWVMFIPRVDRVLITEILPPPGSLDPRSYVVDNVPLGLAGAGYLVSNIGVKISGLYDDVMSRPNDSERIMQGGGLGRNLMLLSTIREMVADPRFGQVDFGETNAFQNYRRDMGAYMENCVLPPVNNGYIPSAAVLSKPVRDGVFNEAFALEKRWVWQHWAAPAGSKSYEREQVTCAAARERLLADMGSSALVDGFDDALKKTRTGASSEEIMAAYANAAGEDGLSMQEKIVGHMTSVLLRDAQMRGAMTSADRQAITMLEEANMRRSTQWAAEENLFIRLLRPIVGFFEALFYALGPIMAFVMMLGPTGWSLLMKYLMLTVWVALWFPMLAITNLYSKVKMEDFFARLGTSDLSPNDLDLIANEAMNTLGATSALVAATPALAMSLIYGGAVSMSYLAGRLNHNDVVDETKMAPQVGTIAPVQQTKSHASTDAGAGTEQSGRTGYSINESAVAQQMASSAETRADELSAAAQQSFFQAVGQGYKMTDAGATFGSTKESRGIGNGLKNALTDTEGMSDVERRGAGLTKSLTDDQMAFVAFANQYAKANKKSLGVAIKELGGSVGYSEEQTRTILETTQTSSQVGESERLNNERAIQASIEYGLQKANITESSLSRAVVSEMGAKFESAGEASQSTEEGARVENAYREAATARVAYETASKDVEQGGIGRDLKDTEIVRRLENEPAELDAFNRRAAAFFDRVGGEDMAHLRERYYEGSASGRMKGRSAEAIQAAANIEALYRGTGIPAEHRGEAAEILGGAMGMTPLAASSGPRIGEGSRNAGAGAEAVAAVGTREKAAPINGPEGITPESVQGGATGRIGGATTKTTTNFDSAGAQLDGNRVGTDFRTLEAEHAAAMEKRAKETDARLEAHPAYQAWEMSAEAKAATVRAQAEEIVANNWPVGGDTGDASTRDWAATVSKMTTAANNFEAKGFYEEAAMVRAAREETIQGMLAASASEEYYGGWAPEGAKQYLAASRAVSDWYQGESAAAAVDQFVGNIGARGFYDTKGQIAVREALIAAGKDEGSPEVQAVNARIPIGLGLSAPTPGVEFKTDVPVATLPKQ